MNCHAAVMNHHEPSDLARVLKMREGQGEEVSSSLNGRDLMQLCRFSTRKMTNAVSPDGS